MDNNQSEEEITDHESMISVILAESFRHWRHIENLRQGFTAVWAAVVAGVLAFISQTKNILENVASIPALFFLVLLTFLGLLMSIRLSSNIEPCEQNIREILASVDLGKYDPTIGWEKGITKHFRLRRVFVFTYLAALIFLLTLIVLTLARL
jgi:hypothetical protein